MGHIDDISFGQTEISEDAVAFTIQNEVLRLQVSVDDVGAVDVVQGGTNFRAIKTGSGFGEALAALKVEEELVDMIGPVVDVVQCASNVIQNLP